MFVKCVVCGRRVNTTAKNYIYANETHQHRKCPRQNILNEQEKEIWTELRDTINQACIDYDKPANWTLITAQMKRYIEMGYSYADQLYTLDYVMKRDGTFWGYGRIEKFFGHAIEHKKREEEFLKRKKEMEEEKSAPIRQIPSKPSFLNM